MRNSSVTTRSFDKSASKTSKKTLTLISTRFSKFQRIPRRSQILSVFQPTDADDRLVLEQNQQKCSPIMIG